MKWITYRGKRIYAYSDTHGKHHILPANADVIICAGDIGLYTEEDAAAYMKILGECPCPIIFFIPGNHDLFFDIEPERAMRLLPPNVYLLDGAYIYGGIRFYGLPAVPWLHTEVILPTGIDILVTHGAPKAIWMKVVDVRYSCRQFKRILPSFISSVIFIVPMESFKMISCLYDSSM